MSPSKFQDSDVTKGMINGPRPLPLRVNKNSHVIHKQAAAAEAAVDQSAAKLPIIIYTHSPKVIHTQAGAFMAVVQRLTGLQRDEDSDDGDKGAEKQAAGAAINEQDSFSGEKDAGGVNNVVGYDERNDATSALVDGRRFIGGGVKQESAAVPPPMYKMSNAYLIDAPLFTPNSNEFFCASRPNPLFQSPNMAAAANSNSPSFMDYMKAFPDY